MGAFAHQHRMENQASTAARQNAKTLRIGMTDAERRLWSRVRREQLGFKFRRQHPFGTYVLDFVCLDAKLVVEVDGSQHRDQQAYDERRSAWLASQGYSVLRFWSNEVLSETDAVVIRIIQSLGPAAALAPTPTLPQRGRESTQGKSS
jgi:very-short-patch-repair endonuclease